MVLFVALQGKGIIAQGPENEIKYGTEGIVFGIRIILSLMAI